MEKKKAKEVYDNAVKEGHTTILGSVDRFSGDLLHLGPWKSSKRRIC
ncbi:hypothetical protein Avbf_17332 [Armadillidium vulgare]|nr:hypothetical protein Avbf_17332 [Armadillidium vulgare]